MVGLATSCVQLACHVTSQASSMATAVCGKAPNKLQLAASKLQNQYETRNANMKAAVQQSRAQWSGVWAWGSQLTAPLLTTGHGHGVLDLDLDLPPFFTERAVKAQSAAVQANLGKSSPPGSGCQDELPLPHHFFLGFRLFQTLLNPNPLLAAAGSRTPGK
jgi:hypothetical protein